MTKQQVHDGLQALVQTTRTSSGVMTDTNGLGRSITFMDEQSKTGEWRAEALGVFACRCAQPGEVDPVEREAAILESDVDFEFRSVAFAVQEIAVQFDCYFKVAKRTMLAADAAPSRMGEAWKP